MPAAFLERLERFGRVAEDALLVLILSSMILLAAGQIVLRNVLDIGFIWGDEALRLMVLWLAVAGAVAASRTDKHINIDVLDRTGYRHRFANCARLLHRLLRHLLLFRLLRRLLFT